MDNGLKNADDLLRGIFSHMGNVGLVDMCPDALKEERICLTETTTGWL